MHKRLRTAALCGGALLAATSAPAQDLAARLGSADAVSGEKLVRQCQACHTFDEGGPNRVGPNLYRVVGNDRAAVDGYRYSSALRKAGGQWTPENLDAFLENPRGTIKGTRMTFRGLSDAGDRADVIAYLNELSDAPLDFGAADSEGGTGQEETQPEAEDFGLLFVADGVELTFYTCTACHSEMIVVQQGKTRDGWDHLLDWMQEEQGMAELSAEDRNAILDYLAANYNVDRPHFPQR